MKTRIRCTERTVNGVVTKTYRAEVFGWRGLTLYLWSPAIYLLNEVDRDVYWADDDQLKEMFGGHEPKTEERAKALIDRLWRKVGEQSQERSSKKTTYYSYP